MTEFRVCFVTAFSDQRRVLAEVMPPPPINIEDDQREVQELLDHRKFEIVKNSLSDGLATPNSPTPGSQNSRFTRISYAIISRPFEMRSPNPVTQRHQEGGREECKVAQEHDTKSRP
jgi:hypothetical protein